MDPNGELQIVLAVTIILRSYFKLNLIFLGDNLHREGPNPNSIPEILNSENINIVGWKLKKNYCTDGRTDDGQTDGQ
jgi:hypothetical protein